MRRVKEKAYQRPLSLFQAALSPRTSSATGLHNAQACPPMLSCSLWLFMMSRSDSLPPLTAKPPHAHSLTLPRSNVPTIPFCISYTPLEPCSFPSSEGNLLLLWEIPTCLCHQFLGASPGPSFWTHTQHLEGTYVPLCLGSML